MHGLARCKHERRYPRACEERTCYSEMSQQKPGMGNEAWECEWRHALEVRGGFSEIWKSQLVELRTRLRTGRVDFRGTLRPDEFVRYGRHTCWRRTDGKVSIERFCISFPYVETFNSKVIKGFVPELRSRFVFFVFRDSYVLCIYVMNILCTFRISVSGDGTFRYC